MTLRTALCNPVTATIAIDSLILATNLLPAPFRLLALGAIICILLLVFGGTCHTAWQERHQPLVVVLAPPACIATWIALAMVLAVSR
jgi:Na+/proline symporter